MNKRLKLLIFFNFFIIISLFSQEQLNQKFSIEELNFIKKSYNWDNEKFIIINYTQPMESCHYNNYQNFNQSKKWWKKFYSNMKLVDVKNIFVYSDLRRFKKNMDFQSNFHEKDKFFFNKIFNKYKTCFGVLVISNDGNYQYKAGEYLQEDIVELLSKFN